MLELLTSSSFAAALNPYISHVRMYAVLSSKLKLTILQAAFSAREPDEKDAMFDIWAEMPL